ncbi:MAG: hypothetical protein H6625_11430 [Bdellovibrionaceae bacterium]|nr:hypothetical protein [Pseudobdellovibrionaceae bacterium]
MKRKKLKLTISIRKAIYWSLSGFMVAYFLNACGEDFDQLIGNEDQNNYSDSEHDPSSINYIQYDPITNKDPDKNSNGSSTGGSFGFSGGNSGSSASRFNSGPAGGIATAGGALDQGSTNDSKNRTLAYSDYDGSGFYYFSKMTEPEPVFTHEGKPFALQFVAIGRFPLKYIWYKESTAGRKVVGTDSTVFAKVAASTNDQGKYFATVTDADGNMLTSKTVELKVRPSNKPCPGGSYGPSNGYDFEQLVHESRMPAGYRHLSANVNATKSTHTLEINCSLITSFYQNCSGTLVYQCSNEKYIKLFGQCICNQDLGG